VPLPQSPNVPLPQSPNMPLPQSPNMPPIHETNVCIPPASPPASSTDKSTLSDSASIQFYVPHEHTDSPYTIRAIYNDRMYQATLSHQHFASCSFLTLHNFRRFLLLTNTLTLTYPLPSEFSLSNSLVGFFSCSISPTSHSSNQSLSSIHTQISVFSSSSTSTKLCEKVDFSLQLLSPSHSIRSFSSSHLSLLRTQQNLLLLQLKNLQQNMSFLQHQHLLLSKENAQLKLQHQDSLIILSQKQQKFKDFLSLYHKSMAQLKGVLTENSHLQSLSLPASLDE
jgi:hypothetical protein